MLGMIVQISMFPYACKLKKELNRERRHCDCIFVGL